MLPLLKRNFLISSSISNILFISGFIIIAYVVMIPPTPLFFLTIFAMLITIFYYDDKNNINRFLISLPITRKTIIRSRYIYFAGLSILLILFQWIVAQSLSPILSDPNYYVYDWRDMVVLVCLALIMIAICIPIFYLFQSFSVSVGIVMIVFPIATYFLLTPITNVLGMTDYVNFNKLDPGFVLLVEKYIPTQPYIIIVLVSILILYISIKISEYLFLKKEF